MNEEDYIIETWEDEPSIAACQHCGRELEWVECDQCDSEGLWGHDCGEDCCACLDPEPNEPCAQCAGQGGWWWCDNGDCAGKK